MNNVTIFSIVLWKSDYTNIPAIGRFYNTFSHSFSSFEKKYSDAKGPIDDNDNDDNVIINVLKVPIGFFTKLCIAMLTWLFTSKWCEDISDVHTPTKRVNMEKMVFV